MSQNKVTAETAAHTDAVGLAGFLLGALGMFATMYSTQAILPTLSRRFDVSPAEAGLTISVVVIALAAGSWIWGPISDSVGRRRAIVLASGLLVVPTIGAGLAPSFAVLLVFRGLQGLCMPGLLTVGVPYVMEAFGRTYGGRVMGLYVSALVVGGLIGRLGIGLVAAAVGWRWAVGGLAILPLLGVLVMHRTLPREPAAESSSGGFRTALGQWRNRVLVQAAVAGSCLFFVFVGTFSFVLYRLEQVPFHVTSTQGSLLFALWVVGAIGPVSGKLADRMGWKRVAIAAMCLSVAGVLMTLPNWLPAIVLGLALIATAMFSGITAAQLGVSSSSTVDRGMASAFYFTCYYTCGAVGAYLPGLLWKSFGWTAVVGLMALVLAAGIGAQAARKRG